MPMVFVAAGRLLGPRVLDWVSFSPTVELGKEFTELALGILCRSMPAGMRKRKRTCRS
jgi:hypothetical protein